MRLASQPAPLSLAFLVALALPALAWGQGEIKDPEELFAKGVALHQAGDTLGAISYYEALLKLQPGRVDALSNLGAALVKLGKYEDAVGRYREALAAEPGLVGVRLNLGLAFYKAGRIDEAATQFEVVVKDAPRHPAATLLLADCRLRTGEPAKVVALLSPLEAELANDRLFSYLLGTAFIQENQLERGQAVIDRLFREGDSAEAHLLLGAQYMRRGDRLKALPELQKAVELNPRLPTVHSVYGRALMDNRDSEGAIRAFRKELEQNPNDFDANLFLGLLLRAEDRLDEAMAYLKRAGRLRPRDANVAYGLGRVHLAAGRLPEARASLELLTETAPGYVQGHVLLAQVYYRLGERGKAEEERQIVLRLRDEAKGRTEIQDVPGHMRLDGGPAPPGEATPPGSGGPRP
jgi:tetratricopeptide (TPR) repeat protein